VRELKRGGFDLAFERVETPDTMRAALRERSWDIVISDYAMPQFDGLAALHLLKRTGLDLPFILVSGTIGEEVAVGAMRAGADDYLMKDNLRRLAPAVERELADADVRRSRRQGEAALAAERERLAVTLESIGEAILVLDADRRVVMANGVGQSFLARWAETGVGEALTHLAGHDLDNLLAPPAEGKTYHEVSVATSPQCTLEVTAHAIEQGPEPGGWVLVVRDVTDERAIEERVQSQDRLAAVGQLAAGIAHDFNNILTVIIGLADLLQRNPQLPDRTRSSLNVIFEQGKRAAGLVRQILDFSRKSYSQKKRLDLLPYLKEMTRFIRSVIPENIALELEAEAGEYVVHADPTQIQQVVANLIVNARDAMPDGGRLRLSLSPWRVEPGLWRPFPDMQSGEWVLLKVADTGTGIPPQVLPHIFEPFFTTKEVGQGTGLGLAQVYGIVRQHDGFVDVQTEIGKGTTFILYLPLARAAEERAEEATEKPIRGRGQTILLVEDEEPVLDVGKEMLETLGYRVLTARNGQDALHIFDKHESEIALIISDVTMPEISGLGLVKAIKERGSAVKVVVVSGYPLVEGWQRAWGENVVAWVSKPLRLKELAEVVARGLKQKSDEAD
jgi:signal transduction histidine kinase